MRQISISGFLIVTILAVSAGVQAIEVTAALEKLGFSSDAEQKVIAGEFVETSLPVSSERELNIGISFLVKTAPELLSRKLREEKLLQKVDPTVIAYGTLEGDGTPAQLAALKLTPAQLKAYTNAKAGDDLNLSVDEITALKSAGKDSAAIQGTVHELLLARYRAYRSKGLAGIMPYARRESETDPGGDLSKFNRFVRKTGLLSADFYNLLDNYPTGVPSNLTENFYWSQFTAHGADTIALVHVFQGTFAGTLIAVQRHYYVSTGYNIEQAIAGFLPVKEGTLVIYTNRTSTDQLAGFGSGAKRTIGRKIMASELKKLFEKTRTAVSK
jgi:hypothetical protein